MRFSVASVLPCVVVKRHGTRSNPGPAKQMFVGLGVAEKRPRLTTTTFFRDGFKPQACRTSDGPKKTFTRDCPRPFDEAENFKTAVSRDFLVLV